MEEMEAQTMIGRGFAAAARLAGVTLHTKLHSNNHHLFTSSSMAHIILDMNLVPS